jgi:hypothetical protein
LKGEDGRKTEETGDFTSTEPYKMEMLLEEDANDRMIKNSYMRHDVLTAVHTHSSALSIAQCKN